MEIFYTAYTRPVQSVNYFFVKRFNSFPELQGVPDILDSYGMHTNFKSACRIAGLEDTVIMKKLLEEINTATTLNAKVIHMDPPHAILKTAQ